MEASTEKRREKKKEKKKLEIIKENREIEWQTFTNRSIPSLPLKALLSTKGKEFFWAQVIQVRFPQSD